MKIDELIECLHMESEAAYNAENLILRDTLDKAAETIRLLWEVARENSLAKYKRQIDEWSGNNGRVD